MTQDPQKISMAAKVALARRQVDPGHLLTDEQIERALQMQPLTIQLKKSVEWVGEVLQELTVRPPRVADLRGWPLDGDKQHLGHIIDVAAQLLDATPSMLERLDYIDAARAMKAATLFFMVRQGAFEPLSVDSPRKDSNPPSSTD